MDACFVYMSQMFCISSSLVYLQEYWRWKNLNIDYKSEFFVIENVKMNFLVWNYGHMIKWFIKCVWLHIKMSHNTVLKMTWTNNFLFALCLDVIKY